MVYNFTMLRLQGAVNPFMSMANKGKGGSAPAPDYTPMANASKEAAQIGADLGREQLAEDKRQYDLNMQTLQPMIDASIKQQQLAYDQGQQNFDTFTKEGRPIQQQLASLAMGGDYTDAQKAKQEEAANTAIADARVGTNQQMQQLIRQGLRYGWSPDKTASLGSSFANQNAQLQVAGANQARTQKQGQQLAQMGDVYNTYAGLGSSAPAFYNAGTGAGQAGSGSQLGMSGQYLNGMNAGVGTIMQGKGQQIQGLGSVLNAQTSYANSQAQLAAGQASGMGSMVGAGIGAAAVMI